MHGFDKNLDHLLAGIAGKAGYVTVVAPLVENLPAMRGDLGSTPWLGRSPERGKGCLLQYSGLENLRGLYSPWEPKVKQD